jgi:hypothetical protein
LTAHPYYKKNSKVHSATYVTVIPKIMLWAIGTAHFKNVNNHLNINIYSYLETSRGQNSNLYLNVDHFFNISVN